MVQRMVKTHFCGRSQQVKNPTMGTPWPPAREQTWIIQLGSNTFCISVFPTDSGVLAMNVISLIHLMLLSPPASPRGRQPYRYLPAGSWGTKCQGDKQDLPALWAGRGAAPHPGLPAEPSPHLNSVSHTLSGFWSPPARLTHRLSKEKAKKKEKGREKEREKKKPSQAKMPVPSLWRGGELCWQLLSNPQTQLKVERMPWHCGARSVGSCLSTLSGQLDRAHLAWTLSTCQQAGCCSLYGAQWKEKKKTNTKTLLRVSANTNLIIPAIAQVRWYHSLKGCQAIPYLVDRGRGRASPWGAQASLSPADLCGSPGFLMRTPQASLLCTQKQESREHLHGKVWALGFVPALLHGFSVIPLVI